MSLSNYQQIEITLTTELCRCCCSLLESFVDSRHYWHSHRKKTWPDLQPNTQFRESKRCSWPDSWWQNARHLSMWLWRSWQQQWIRWPSSNLSNQHAFVLTATFLRLLRSEPNICGRLCFGSCGAIMIEISRALWNYNGSVILNSVYCRSGMMNLELAANKSGDHW